jgi:hypothetical protein
MENRIQRFFGILDPLCSSMRSSSESVVLSPSVFAGELQTQDSERGTALEQVSLSAA